MFNTSNIVMKQPLEPSKEDCCNSGCNPCIFDVFDKQLKVYQKFLESGEVPSESPENAISQLEYAAFVVIQNVQVCETYKLLRFKKLYKDGKKVKWKPGDHVLLKYISEQITCTRAYTPLRYKYCNEDCDFSILVKIYTNGLVSNYLNSLKEGEHTLWRGPYGAYEVPNNCDRIIMIAQGTGIVAFLELIESILNNDEDMTRIILYYCCQNQNTILFRDELYSFKAYWNFTYNIFLSNGVSEK